MANQIDFKLNKQIKKTVTEVAESHHMIVYNSKSVNLQ